MIRAELHTGDDPINWPMDAFFAAIGHVQKLRREREGKAETMAERARKMAIRARERAKWGESAWW